MRFESEERAKEMADIVTGLQKNIGVDSNLVVRKSAKNVDVSILCYCFPLSFFLLFCFLYFSFVFLFN
jgi:hypothetical protein